MSVTANAAAPQQRCVHRPKTVSHYRLHVILSLSRDQVREGRQAITNFVRLWRSTGVGSIADAITQEKAGCTLWWVSNGLEGRPSCRQACS